MAVSECLLTLIFMAILAVLMATHAVFCRLDHVLEVLYLIAQGLEKLPIWQILVPTEKHKRHVAGRPRIHNQRRGRRRPKRKKGHRR